MKRSLGARPSPKRRWWRWWSARARFNGIENFWGLAKLRPAKFRGLSRSTLRLHLKECEFRFNHRRDNLYQLLLKEFKNNPLN